MNWTALVPLKLGPQRKSRLAPRLTPEQRAHVSDAMVAHVLACVAATPGVLHVATLSPAPIAAGEWRADLGRGLNAELEAARADIPGALAIVFADLPLLSSADVEALLRAAERAGVALAPDRHRRGTNALAIADERAFAFMFGDGSLERHVAQAAEAALIDPPGLTHDIDTVEDMQAATAAGWRRMW